MDKEIFVLIRHFYDCDINSCLFIGSWIECMGKLYIDMKSEQFNWIEKDGECYREGVTVTYPIECEPIDGYNSGYHWEQVISYPHNGKEHTIKNSYEIYRYTPEKEKEEG